MSVSSGDLSETLSSFLLYLTDPGKMGETAVLFSCGFKLFVIAAIYFHVQSLNFNIPNCKAAHLIDWNANGNTLAYTTHNTRTQAHAMSITLGISIQHDENSLRLCS